MKLDFSSDELIALVKAEAVRRLQTLRPDISGVMQCEIVFTITQDEPNKLWATATFSKGAS